VTFVSNCPLPYHTPILNELARLVELHVIYMARRHPLDESTAKPVFADLWGTAPEFEHSFYWSRTIRWPSRDLRIQFSLGVSRRLGNLGPDIVFFSSWGPLMLEPLAWKIVTGRRAVMWAESTTYSGLLRSPASNALRRHLMQQIDSFVANGSRATAYLRQLGVREDRVITSCLPSTAGPHRSGSRVAPGPRYLFVGRLIRRKRPDVVLSAFEQVLERIPTATLTIVGDGPLMAEVSVSTRRLGPSVRLVGRAEGPRLHAIYSEHDVLVLPALREVWGLVVNEALSHGLFVIASDQVGSAFDLLSPETGRIVPAGDMTALVDELVRSASIPQDAESRERRMRTVKDCSPGAFARDIVRACNLVS
jgi:glycosyltransferase involved in cell wall biosynthesis